MVNQKTMGKWSQVGGWGERRRSVQTHNHAGIIHFVQDFCLRNIAEKYYFPCVQSFDKLRNGCTLQITVEPITPRPLKRYSHNPIHCCSHLSLTCDSLKPTLRSLLSTNGIIQDGDRWSQEMGHLCRKVALRFY